MPVYPHEGIFIPSSTWLQIPSSIVGWTELQEAAMTGSPLPRWILVWQVEIVRNTR